MMYKRLRPNVNRFFFLGGLILLSSCRSLTDPYGIPEEIPSDFWSYYLRGLAYSYVGEWEKAANDFRVAVGYEPGAEFSEYKDKARTKTYGLHFLTDYYPHRELGVCYYYLSNFSEAKKELLLSLQMLESSRAKAYMNKVLRLEHGHSDAVGSESITFDIHRPPSKTVYSKSSRIVIEGEVTSPNGVEKIWVNDSPVFIELAQPTFQLRRNVSLSSRRQNLVLRAQDLQGNEAVWTAEIIVDFSGPSISISPSGDGSEDEVAITVTDNVALSRIAIDGKILTSLETERRHHEKVSTLPERVIKIEAVDKAGNKTKTEISTKDLRRACLDSRSHHPDQRLVSLVGRCENCLILSQQYSSPHRLKPRMIADTRLEVTQANLVASRKKDTMPPRIRLRPYTAERTTVTTEFYTLDIAVEDKGYIDSLGVTHNRQHEFQSIRESKANRLRVSQTFELELGVNEIEIVARDWSGNERKKKFMIERKLPFRLRQQLRMTLAIQTPDGTNQPKNVEFMQKFEEIGNSKIVKTVEKIMDKRSVALEKLNLKEILEDILINQDPPQRFNLIERSPEILQFLLLEEEVKSSALVDYRYAVNSGRLQPAEWLLVGSYSPWSGPDNWVIQGKIVDVSTGLQILSNDVHLEGFEHQEISFKIQGLVDKLVQNLPMVAASLTAIEDSTVTVALGEAEHIQPGFRFLFTSPSAGNSILAWQNKWIQGRVVRVDSLNGCTVEVSPSKGITLIQKDCQAIIR